MMRKCIMVTETEAIKRKRTKIGSKFINFAEIGGICNMHNWLRGWVPLPPRTSSFRITCSIDLEALSLMPVRPFESRFRNLEITITRYRRSQNDRGHWHDGVCSENRVS